VAALRAPGPNTPVDAITRRARAFAPNFMVVHEYGFQNFGAQLVAAANARRIRLVVYAPVSNSGTIEIVSRGGYPAGGDRLSGPRALDMEPGTGWEIDDTTDAVYAFCVLGAGDQAMQFWEPVDDGAPQ
jgi:hypothetical protein